MIIGTRIDADCTGIGGAEADKPLWKDVQRLFEVRNEIAHRGNVASLEDAKALAAARRAATWLDEQS